MTDFELTPPPDYESYDARRVRMERRAREIEGDGVLFNEASWAVFLDLIEEGYTSTEIDECEALPSWSTIRKWMRAEPERRAQYRQARSLSGDALEGQLLGLAMATVDKDDVPVNKFKADTLKWVMARRSPRDYGDPKFVLDSEPSEQQKMEIEGGLPDMPMD